MDLTGIHVNIGFHFDKSSIYHNLPIRNFFINIGNLLLLTHLNKSSVKSGTYLGKVPKCRTLT